MTNRVALNVIGQPYNANAVMIGKAFDYAYQIMNGTDKARNAYFKAGIVGINAIAAEYVKDTQYDRRYRLHFNAASNTSAIVTYRHARYYVELVYDSVSKSRSAYVYRA